MEGEHSSYQLSNIISKIERFSCAENRLELSLNHELPKSFEHILIGKILSSQNFNSNVVQEIVIKAWNLRRSIKVNMVGRNTFVFAFEHELDMQLAFNRRPWTLKGAHLNLQEWRPDLSWEEVDFSWSTFWIQVHGLPLLWQNQESLERIGKRAGKFKDVDFIGEGNYQCRLYICIRVDINTTKPLFPGFFLPRPSLSDLWINLKYEKLPKICFRCGLLGHDSRFCDINHKTLSN